MNLPPRYDPRTWNLSRHQGAVLAGAAALMAGAATLRLGFMGWTFENAVITVGLLGLDMGAALKVHSIARRRQDQRERRALHERLHADFTVADRQYAGVAQEQRDNKQAAADIEDALELRRILSFDIEAKRKWAAAMAMAGYRAAINTNKGAIGPERLG